MLFRSLGLGEQFEHLIVLRRDPVPFPEFIDQLVQMFELLAETKGLALELQIVDALPAVVLTDEKRLRQILINLLSNAIKYTETGAVTLRIAYRRQLVEFGRRFEPLAHGEQESRQAPVKSVRLGFGSSQPMWRV